MRFGASGLGIVAWSLRIALAVAAVLSTGAAAARAAEGEADDDSLHRLPSDAPLGVGIGWDGAPAYGIDEPVKLRGHMGLTIDLDGGYVGGDFDRRFEGPAVRRGTFHTQGELHHWAAPDYKVQFGVEDESVFLDNFWLRWRGRFAGIDSLKAGFFDPPQSLAALGSSAARGLMELPAPAAAFGPGSRVGVQITGTRDADPDLSWQAALTSVGQTDRNDSESSQSLLRATGRIVWRPWHDEKQEKSLLHLGVSVGYTRSGSEGLRYRARPESFLTDYVVDTDEISGDAVLAAFEVAWRRGPVSVQAELFQNFVEADDGSPRLGGAYLQAGWVLTGEFRSYDRGGAVFGRVEPRKPLAPHKGTWGAVEVTGRVSWLDLDDGFVRGGRMVTTNVGLVWTWNRYVRLHLGWVYAHTDRRIDAGDAQIVQTRFEFRL